MSMKFEMPTTEEENIPPEITKETVALSEEEISQIITNAPEYQEVKDNKEKADEIYRKRMRQAETVIKELNESLEEDAHYSVEIRFQGSDTEFWKAQSALYETHDEAETLAIFKEKTLELYKKSGGKFSESDFEEIFQSTDEFMAGDSDLIEKRKKQLKEIMEQCQKQDGRGFEESAAELKKVAKEADGSSDLRHNISMAIIGKYCTEYFKTRDNWIGADKIKEIKDRQKKNEKKEGLELKIEEARIRLEGLFKRGERG